MGVLLLAVYQNIKRKHCRPILVLLQEANKKIGCFRNRPFWQGQKDSFSSLDARRSGRLYRAKGHGIHCRPILALLREANKKIGCFCNRSFWQGQKDSNPQQRFWRPTCYHYTIPLSTCSVYHESRFLSTGFLQDLARNCIKGRFRAECRGIDCRSGSARRVSGRCRPARASSFRG